ncbi:complement C4-B isoform X2 [Sorex araneus]|uniref:complement C4-B isoform X2 n=1 Tax=Sorex araneus TaxID=42254 RepID=UPI00243380EF|nr:complement C4-B isoform X2 [Sorex araneus]
MRRLWVLTWAFSCLTLSLQEPRLVLLAPSVAHVGVPLSVGVLLQDAPHGQVVAGSVYLRNPSASAHCSPRVNFALRSEKNFELLSLQFPLDMKCGLRELHGVHRVQLLAESPWLMNHGFKGVDTQGINLLLSYRRGHLFLQTDQPVYNPGQRVRYRVFALDQKMRPARDVLMVTVENQHGLRVRTLEKYIPRAIYQDDFVIPDISEPGTWKISARFQNDMESNYSTQFEVKKYVLPNFEVKITPGKPYILTTPDFLDDIQLEVQARYLYGKPVKGVAYVRFGLLGEDDEKTFLRGLESQSKLVDGKCHIALSKAELQGALGKVNLAVTDLPGLRLYVAAAIIESPGGELEEAELTSWRFVSSPYVLDLSSTKRHLVPGTPFLLQALVRDLSGAPASGVPVQVAAKFLSSPGAASQAQNLEQNTDLNGHVIIPVVLPQSTSEMQLSVSAGSSYPASASLSVKAPPAGGPGFLSIEHLDPRPPHVGDVLSLNLRAVGPSRGSFSHYYYMVVSRGRILLLKREPRQDLTSVSFTVGHDMAPSFYFVAFYYHQGLPVANSLRIKVQAGACEGQLELMVPGEKEYRPGESATLRLRTDSRAYVALAAVDTALYAVGSKPRKPLDMGKVFEVMSNYDQGCGPGGGNNALEVFQAAGLAFSDGHLLTPVRQSLGCPKERNSRKRRSLNLQKEMREKLGQYSSPEAKRCCQDGLTKLPMGRTCEQRAARVSPDSCREPFLACCEFAVRLRRQARAKAPEGFARTLETLQEEELIHEDDVVVRSYFPENWLWKVQLVDHANQTTLLFPDSLTTWEIHGVSLSESTGLCVAKPIQLRVFQEFHLHLRLPVSVRRFEQLELRPVLYNYLPVNLTASVHVSPVEGLCLAGGGGLAQQVLVPAGSARPVGFSVVPTAAGDISLKVVARGPVDFLFGDAVSKVLHVEKEGALHLEEIVYDLNPQRYRGRTLEIPGNSDPNKIPDGDFRSYVRVTASDPIDTLGPEGALSPGGLASLLRIPVGCGEQTMILLSPTLAASRYLDKTEQWSLLPPETKDHAVDLIQKGYVRIQQFRKDDGSYGAWLHRKSSTWLTAFVLKILSLAQEQVGGSAEKLQETAQWLLTQQQDDGSFQDLSPVIHRDMQGGLVGSDETVALTAFVVIALHHGLVVFEDDSAAPLKHSVETSISNANSFLAAKAASGLLGAHAAAITAYALTLTKASKDHQEVAHNNLMAMVQETGNSLYWSSVITSQNNDVTLAPPPRHPEDPMPQAPAVWVETTAYGLLHLLLREGKAEMAEQVASWLTQQSSFKGAFRSTQDTVIALDALSAYWIASHTHEEKELNVTLSSMGRSGPLTYNLQLNNHQVQGLEEELQFSLDNKISVKVGGNTKGTLKVLRAYNILDMNTTCQDLQIEVTVTGHVEYAMEANEDYEDYYYGEDVQGDDPEAHAPPVTPLQLFEGRRNRRRREAPKAGSEQEFKVQYTVCIWRSGKVGLSGMAIADITLLSGFHALRADLEKLTSLVDRYVSHFETEGPHVLLYFDSVPTTKECVGFGAIQEVAVGLVQPASATLYDYYNPERKCAVFYGAPSRSKILSTLCSGDVCQCAEGKCPRQRRALERELQEDDGYRMKFACYDPRVEYGFRAKVLREDSKTAFRLFETSLTQVLHYNKDVKATPGQTRNFLVRASCRLRLETGKEYLIMGLDGPTKDHQGNPQYLLDSNSWIEEVPSERLCRTTRHRGACAQFQDFLQEYSSQGCQV